MMEKRFYPELDEHIFWNRLPNGLTIAIVPRPGFTKKLAYLVTDYGSIHREFAMDSTPMQVPAGIAHFLEHKLFDMPDRDISAEFAALGAIPNAFTSFDMTAYHFSCTDNFYESLRLLLEFVFTPCFTQESVDKEQGIIAQEIDMNADNPDTCIFETLMGAMYQTHPIREPILGTRESIGRITPEFLTACHKAFYRPDNMLLCIVGDADPEQVTALAQELSPESNPVVTVKRHWAESMACPKTYTSASMEVAMPMFQLGFKCEPAPKGTAAVRQEIIGDLAAEALFGESSKLYLRLYQEGLIDSSFGGGFETVEDMAMLTASGDSWQPEAVRDAILDEVQALLASGISAEDFLRMKRSALGRRIRGLDSFDSTCFRICAYHFTGFDYFHFPDIYEEVQAAHILEFLQQVITRERMSLSVIFPTQEVTQ